MFKRNSDEIKKILAESKDLRKSIIKDINFKELILELIESDYPESKHDGDNYEDIDFGKKNFRLVGADFSSSKFYNCSFEDIDFKKLKLKLIGVDFSGCDFYGCNFDEQNLKYTNFEKCPIYKSSFNKAKLENSIFNKASLIGSQFNEATMTSMQCKNTNIVKCEFKKTIMNRSNFAKSKFNSTELKRADLNLSNLTQAKFIDSNLSEAKLERVSIQETLFYNIDVNKETSFLFSNLKKAEWVNNRSLIREFEEKQYIHDLYIYYRDNNTMLRLLDIWKYTSNYGKDIKRWIFCSIGVILFFSSFFFLDHIISCFCGTSPLYSFLCCEIIPRFDIKYQTLLSPLYFSAVTFTTLGFGDIVPINAAGQLLVMLEVIIGYVMLGGLVSIFANIFSRRE